MKTIPQYCQNCREKNALGDTTCRKCGTRLMLVVFPQSLKYDTNHVPTYYEDHLLERVTALELRLSQITERLAMTLDLMLRQTKTSHTDHLLLETLIESLNSLGAIKKEALTQNWRERVNSERKTENAEDRSERILDEILKHGGKMNPELFNHLVKEGVRLLSVNEEKQAFRMFERALLLSPDNLPLLLFIAENYFLTDKLEYAKGYLEKARIISPDNTKMRVLFGVVLTEEGDIEQSEKMLKPLVGQHNVAFCVNYILGMVAALKGNWKSALTVFKSSADLKESPEINYLTGCIYFEQKHYKSAIKYLGEAVALDANFADAWFMLGMTYTQLNNAKKSKESVDIARQSKEAGAQCHEFLKKSSVDFPLTALPFLRMKSLKPRLLTNGSVRLTKLFKEEIFKVLNQT